MADLKKLYQSKIYKAWANMKNRCNNLNYEWYKNYWWRWIKYDPKWETFEWFYNDMKLWHKDNLTLERIDNNWNYCKKNCKWATKQTQANNRSTSTSVTYKWKTKTLPLRSRQKTMHFMVRLGNLHLNGGTLMQFLQMDIAYILAVKLIQEKIKV